MNEEEKETIKYFYNLRALIDEKDMLYDEGIGKEYGKEKVRQITIILNLIVKLQKENEELKNKLLDTLEGQKVIKEETPQYIKENFIPIQKIKDKIEELNQYYKKEIYPSLSQWRDISITEHYDEMIELLQEIIGDK